MPQLVALVLDHAGQVFFLTESFGIIATARITGVNRETVGKIAFQVGLQF
jgi:hypothetical protein